MLSAYLLAVSRSVRALLEPLLCGLVCISWCHDRQSDQSPVTWHGCLQCTPAFSAYNGVGDGLKRTLAAVVHCVSSCTDWSRCISLQPSRKLLNEVRRARQRRRSGSFTTENFMPRITAFLFNILVCCLERVVVDALLRQIVTEWKDLC